MPRPKGSKNKDKTWTPKRAQPPRDINEHSDWKNKVNKIIDVIHEKKAKRANSQTSYLIKKPLTFVNYQPILPKPSFLIGKTISPALLHAIHESLIEFHVCARHVITHQNYGHI